MWRRAGSSFFRSHMIYFLTIWFTKNIWFNVFRWSSRDSSSPYELSLNYQEFSKYFNNFLNQGVYNVLNVDEKKLRHRFNAHLIGSSFALKWTRLLGGIYLSTLSTKKGLGRVYWYRMTWNLCTYNPANATTSGIWRYFEPLNSYPVSSTFIKGW